MRRGNYVGKSFAKTFYSPDEGLLQTIRRAVEHKLVSISKVTNNTKGNVRRLGAESQKSLGYTYYPASVTARVPAVKALTQGKAQKVQNLHNDQTRC